MIHMEHELRRTRIAAAVRGEVADQRIKRVVIAEALHISPDTLRSRLKGEKPFYLDEFVAICHLLNVPVAEMLDRAGVK